MSSKTRHALRRGAALIAGGALAAGSFIAFPAAASAAPDGSTLVISEVYGGGGNSGAPLTHDFVELFNPTDEVIDLGPLAIEYRSASGGSGGTVDLVGQVDAGVHFLIQLAAGNNSDLPGLPTPDQDGGNVNLAGANGRVFLFDKTSSFDSAIAGDRAGADGLVDMIGYGSAASFEGAAAPALSNATSASRDAQGTDTDDNAADFVRDAPTPTNSRGESDGTDPGDDDEEEPTDPVEPVEPQDMTIAEAGQAAVGTRVRVQGVVTADWSDGGFNGFVVQDPAGDPTDGVSDAIFVYQPNGFVPSVGDSVRFDADRAEFAGSPQLAQVGWIDVLDTSLGDVTPITDASILLSEEGREAHSAELVHFDDEFTVSDNYQLNVYGSFAVTLGDDVIYQPTAKVDPHDVEAIDEITREQLSRTIVVDDARSMNFNAQANRGNAFTYLTPENPVRVGSSVSFTAPGVLDYRFNQWAIQPTTPIAFGDDGSGFVDVVNDRSSVAEPGTIAGDISIANFNVLNYFPTTGEEFVAAGLGTCTWYADRDGNRITNNRCNPDGPRGAANEENLARQQVKTVAAINALDASIVSLQEMENSAAYGKDRDFATEHLVEALNEAAGFDKWDVVESASELPVNEDVIRNAYIYQPAIVETVGESYVLTGDDAFHNAREPLAQAFQPVGGDEEQAFLVLNNHFKSKGSGFDDGTGQGNANPDRVAQAEGLIDFTAEIQDLTGIDAVFLTGDFNAYAMEDPLMVLEGAGYTNLNYALNGGEPTYLFGGFSGSLDHIFANAQALDMVEDVDVWEINGQEQIGFEYSRYNGNATLLYNDDVFRTSDHNPIRVGLSTSSDTAPSIPAWDAAAIYHAGDRVSFEGEIYQAQWWTTERPGVSPWGSWMQVGETLTCAVGDVAAWTASQVYTGGERVAFDGQTFTAKWWTRNQQPGQQWGPWDPSGSC
ncbi:ExeM/NucH family extracellular endonuclease [Microbacterium amylolyticum]|uniref:Extracellular nuclease n=1 Tax=Microbacterium amylolyticum TaxID=936337 RepID=A0ABS4ZGT9_9MICO|nr:ExeM/NucH family extracellular endonuclease [Microbacterium amylolyticum]MBP2436200.1 putative extracellular nuclease [Microbacterium amylolyticum]